MPFHSVAFAKEYSTKYEGYKIPLKELKYKTFWLQINNVDEQKLGKINLNNLNSITFDSGERYYHERAEEIKFYNLKFTKTLHWPYYLILGVLFLTLFYWWFIDKRNEERLAVSLKYVAKKEIKGNKAQTVLQFIAENYMSPIITIAMICEQLAISEDKINEELKKETTLTFKPFLNQLRIEEAKRLLSETDSRVSNIAKAVGYDNVTHFNRVFKQEVQCSPSEFRKKHKKPLFE